MKQHEKGVKELSLNELRKELIQLAVGLNSKDAPTPPVMMSQQNLEQEFVALLEDMLGNVRTIDDLFFFFGKTFPDLRETLVTQSSGGTSPQQT